MNSETALAKASATWPQARLCTAHKLHHCDNGVCRYRILPGDQYIDPGDSNPDSAGGFGGYRYCLNCAGGEVVANV